MPIETLDDILEELADKLEIYGAERRCAYINTLKNRIMKAILGENI